MALTIRSLFSREYQNTGTLVLRFLCENDIAALRLTCKDMLVRRVQEYITPAKLAELCGRLPAYSLAAKLYHPLDSELLNLRRLSITDLDISHSISTDTTLSLLATLPLQKLAIGLTVQTSGKGLAHIAKLRIRELDFSSSETWTGNGIDLFREHPHLRSIKLGRVEHFSTNLSYLPELPVQELTMQRSSNHNISDGHLDCLSGLREGSTLNLGLAEARGQDPTPVPPFTDTSLQKLKNLRIGRLHLTLNGEITDSGLVHVASIKSLKSLTLVVYLTHRVTASAFAFLRGANLSELNIIYPKMDFCNSNLRNIASNFPGLRILTLQLYSDAPVSKSGFAHLATLPLLFLGVRNIKGFTDEVLECLQYSPLETLDARGCPITDKGLLTLSKMLNLRCLKLSLRDNREITAMGLNKLEILPEGMASIRVTGVKKGRVFLQRLPSPELIPLEKLQKTTWKIYLEDIWPGTSFKLLIKRKRWKEMLVVSIKQGDRLEVSPRF